MFRLFDKISMFLRVLGNPDRFGQLSYWCVCGENSGEYYNYAKRNVDILDKKILQEKNSILPRI